MQFQNINLLTFSLKLRSQNSNVNDVIPTKMFLQMQIYKQMVNTPWNFFDSVVKFEAYVKRSAGDLDYDFENFSPRKLLKYPAIDSEFIYDEEIHFDFEMLKEQELNHSKDGSVTFVVFVRTFLNIILSLLIFCLFQVTINDMMYSAKADINVYPNLYETDVLTDFKIICHGRKFAAHRVVLGEISPVFLRMLQTEMKESKTCEVVINDIDEDIMVEMIRFIYTGMANLNGIIAEKLLQVADKYGIEKMKLKCIEFLNWDLSVENAIETLVLAEQYEAEDLFNNCIQFIRV